MSQLTISVLGPLAVTLDGTAIRAFKYNKARALLAAVPAARKMTAQRDAR